MAEAKRTSVQNKMIRYDRAETLGERRVTFRPARALLALFDRPYKLHQLVAEMQANSKSNDSPGAALELFERHKDSNFMLTLTYNIQSDNKTVALRAKLALDKYRHQKTDLLLTGATEYLATPEELTARQHTIVIATYRHNDTEELQTMVYLLTTSPTGKYQADGTTPVLDFHFTYLHPLRMHTFLDKVRGSPKTWTPLKCARITLGVKDEFLVLTHEYMQTMQCAPPLRPVRHPVFEDIVNERDRTKAAHLVFEHGAQFNVEGYVASVHIEMPEKDVAKHQAKMGQARAKENEKKREALASLLDEDSDCDCDPHSDDACICCMECTDPNCTHPDHDKDNDDTIAVTDPPCELSESKKDTRKEAD